MVQIKRTFSRSTWITLVIILITAVIAGARTSAPVTTALFFALIVMLIPASLIQRQLREMWLLPGMTSAMLAASVVRNWIRFGMGSPWSIVLDVLFPALLASFATIEGIRALRRHRAGGQGPSDGFPPS